MRREFHTHPRKTCISTIVASPCYYCFFTVSIAGGKDITLPMSNCVDRFKGHRFFEYFCHWRSHFDQAECLYTLQYHDPPPGGDGDGGVLTTTTPPYGRHWVAETARNPFLRWVATTIGARREWPAHDDEPMVSLVAKGGRLGGVGFEHE
jgi:hypothetical protein